MLKLIRKPTRTLYRSLVVGLLWANRRDVMRWAKFAGRAALPSKRPSRADLALEAKVRLAVSADPLLRGDASIRDIRVHDGVVVLESPAAWHNKALAITRIAQISGVESVHTASDVNEQHWLDVDLIDFEVAAATV
ncbi:MAG TPA: hypothetical protein VGM78_12765 [Ilumatobacteraceae bacterium]|jgi:hypothetical protein